jgi:hypothetical protein
MASTALQLAAAACNDAGLDQTLTSFSMAEWPYSSLLDVTNRAIAEMNRAGNLVFGETTQVLTYTPSVYTYNLNTVAANPIEPRRILRLRRELVNQSGELAEYNFRDFQKRFWVNTIPTIKPVAWAKFASTLYLNSIPDQDYTLTMYYYQPIQPIVVGSNDNSVTIVPFYHEDVLREMIFAQLIGYMGRPDFSNAYTLAKQKLATLVAKSNEDIGLPQNMPRAF